MKRRGAGTLSRADIGSKVLLKAWVQRRRDHGGVLFLDLRDRSGVAQVPAASLLLQQDDIVHVTMPIASIDQLDHLLAHPGAH